MKPNSANDKFIQACNKAISLRIKAEYTANHIPSYSNDRLCPEYLLTDDYSGTFGGRWHGSIKDIKEYWRHMVFAFSKD